jgi:hypothetical protein
MGADSAITLDSQSRVAIDITTYALAEPRPPGQTIAPGANVGAFRDVASLSGGKGDDGPALDCALDALECVQRVSGEGFQRGRFVLVSDAVGSFEIAMKRARILMIAQSRASRSFTFMGDCPRVNRRLIATAKLFCPDRRGGCQVFASIDTY